MNVEAKRFTCRVDHRLRDQINADRRARMVTQLRASECVNARLAPSPFNRPSTPFNGSQRDGGLLLSTNRRSLRHTVHNGGKNCEERQVRCILARPPDSLDSLNDPHKSAVTKALCKRCGCGSRNPCHQQHAQSNSTIRHAAAFECHNIFSFKHNNLYRYLKFSSQRHLIT